MQHAIPAPGHGALEGAPESHEPGSPESAGAPQFCETCQHFRLLDGSGHTGICFYRWRGLDWREPVPLTCVDGGCEHHQKREDAALA